MALNNPRPHHGHTAEYQSSGIPFVKTINSGNANATTINFPFVTRFIVISNPSDTAVKIHFSATGVALANANPATTHFVVPSNSISPRLEVKVKTLFVTHANGKSCSVLAGLTNVKAADFPDITELSGIKGEA